VLVSFSHAQYFETQNFSISLKNLVHLYTFCSCSQDDRQKESRWIFYLWRALWMSRISPYISYLKTWDYSNIVKKVDCIVTNERMEHGQSFAESSVFLGIFAHLLIAFYSILTFRNYHLRAPGLSFKSHWNLDLRTPLKGLCRPLKYENLCYFVDLLPCTG
jgi:hypothetical protein